MSNLTGILDISLLHKVQKSDSLKDKILIYDKNLPDLNLLLSDIDTSYKLIGVSKRDSIIDTLNLIFKSYSNIENLAFLCHGRPGNLIIGRENINTKNLSEINRGNNFNSLNSISLYSCEVAKDYSFIKALNKNFNCQIDASEEKVGHPQNNANWNLNRYFSTNLAPAESQNKIILRLLVLFST